MRKVFVPTLLAATLVFTPYATVYAAGGGHGNNHLALFGGATKTDYATNNTIGIEYEYRTPLLDHKLGISAVSEKILANHEANVIALGLMYHPWKGLKVNLAAGQESALGHSENLTRVGMGYDFHYKALSFGPAVSIDSVAGHTAQVFGFAVGAGF